jgi:hypothetical protein
VGVNFSAKGEPMLIAADIDRLQIITFGLQRAAGLRRFHQWKAPDANSGRRRDVRAADNGPNSCPCGLLFNRIGDRTE